MTTKKFFFIVLAISACGFVFAQDVSKPKKIDFDISIGYSPTMLFTDDTIGDTFTPAGAYLNFGILFLHTPYGNMGAELSANWSMAQTMPTAYNLNTHIIPVHVNFVHQYHFNKRLALGSHVGIGTNMYNLQFEPKEKSPGLLEFSFSANLGTALQIAIDKGFYAEIGANYIVSLPKGVVFHQLMPALAFGYRF